MIGANDQKVFWDIDVGGVHKNGVEEDYKRSLENGLYSRELKLSRNQFEHRNYHSHITSDRVFKPTNRWATSSKMKTGQ